MSIKASFLISIVSSSFINRRLLYSISKCKSWCFLASYLVRPARLFDTLKKTRPNYVSPMGRVIEVTTRPWVTHGPGWVGLWACDEPSKGRLRHVTLASLQMGSFYGHFGDRRF